MDLLKKEYWWTWLILMIASGGISVFILAAFLKIYDKNAWYANWKYWVIGCILILPVFIMFGIFTIQITCQTCAKLNSPFKEIYMSPYIWILGIIIPILGWLFLGLMSAYTSIVYIVMLAQGEGEKYAN